MAAGNWNKVDVPEDKVDALAEQLAQFQATISASFAAFSFRMESLERRSPDVSPAPSSGPTSATSSAFPPRLKLDIPRFDGTNTHAWIVRPKILP
ncbi:hypothetical protein A2U01_0032682, partial [Trifolium medium]|nr:hypothetical protein [Trifolium medium]